SGASIWGSSPTTGNSLVRVGTAMASECGTGPPGVGTPTDGRLPTRRGRAQGDRVGAERTGTDYRRSQRSRPGPHWADSTRAGASVAEGAADGRWIPSAAP